MACDVCVYVCDTGEGTSELDATHSVAVIVIQFE